MQTSGWPTIGTVLSHGEKYRQKISGGHSHGASGTSVAGQISDQFEASWPPSIYGNREVWIEQRWLFLAKRDSEVYRMNGQPSPFFARPKLGVFF